MSPRKITKLTKRAYNVSIIIIEDDTIRNLVIDRFIDRANAIEYTTKQELIQKIFGDYEIANITKRYIVNNIMSGWNAPLKHLIVASRAFRINMCHFLNVNESEYFNSIYEEYDEFEVLERNIRNALTYGDYSPSFLRRMKLITAGDYDAPFGIVLQKNGDTPNTDYFTTKWLRNNFDVNGLVKLGKILNIPIHSFFIPDEDEFHTYMEKITLYSYYNEHYLQNRSEKASAMANNRRRERALQIEPDFDKSKYKNIAMPIYDAAIRNTIIRNIQYLMDLNGIMTKMELARRLNVTPYIAGSLMEGRNTHVDYYFRLCDYFGVFFGDFINPEVTTLYKFKDKNSDIDLRTRLLNECSKAHLSANDLNRIATDDKKFHSLKKSIFRLYRTVNRSTRESNNSNSNGYRTRDKNKYRILFNTLLDYCEIFHTDLITMIQNNVAITREKAPVQKRVTDTAKLITIKDPELAFICNTYQILTGDQKDAVMTIFKYLHDKNTASNSNE